MKKELIDLREVQLAYYAAVNRCQPSDTSVAWTWEKNFAEEIIKIQAPTGFDSWKDAALSERLRRVELQKKLNEIGKIAAEIERVGFDRTPTHQIHFFYPDENIVSPEKANDAVAETEKFWSNYFGMLYKQSSANGQRILNIIAE